MRISHHVLAAVVTWVAIQGAPLRGVRFVDYPDIRDAGSYPHVWSFVHRSASYYDDVRQVMRAVAQRFVGANVAFIELTTEHADAFKFFHLHVEDTDALPLIIAARWPHGWGKQPYQKFLYSKGDAQAVQEETLVTFVNEFIAGQLTPWMRSAEAVEDIGARDRRDGTLEIVGSQFQQAILEGDAKDRDCLLMFFAPWCGFSKQMQPRIDELGRRLSHVTTLDIFKIDGSENDVEHDIMEQVRGYPFLAFFPAGEKSRGVKFSVQAPTADAAAWTNEVIRLLHSHVTHAFSAMPPSTTAALDDKLGRLESTGSLDL